MKARCVGIWPKPGAWARRVIACVSAAALFGQAGCASLPPRGDVAVSVAIESPADVPLVKAARSRANGHPGQSSGLHLLMRPEAAWHARLDLVAQAQRTLDVQYYIFESDPAGLELLAALRAAAARGVRVRLLVDDLQLTQGPAAALGIPNLEVRVFNPLPVRSGGAVKRLVLSLHEFRRVNHRMHNKLLVADGSFSISGGRNIGAEYFMQGEGANFLDLDVLAVGRVVREQSDAFDRYWNSSVVWPLDHLQSSPDPAPGSEVVNEGARAVQAAQGAAESHPFPPPDSSFVWAPVTLMLDDPAKMRGVDLGTRFANSVSAQTLQTIDMARSRVVIVTPYFVPGEVGLGVLARARDRGVTTIIVTNSLGATDEPLVHAAYGRYRRRMLELGVTLYEVSPSLAHRVPQWGNLGRTQGRLHAKLALVDNRWMYIGSMNLDGRSASLNTEIGLVVDSPALVHLFLETVGPERFTGAYEVRLAPDGSLEWLEDGGAVVHTREPGDGPLQALRSMIVLPFLDEELL